jgi:hypothetical protein
MRDWIAVLLLFMLTTRLPFVAWRYAHRRSLRVGAGSATCVLCLGTAGALGEPPAKTTELRLEIPRLETEGPFGSRLRLEVSERIREEFVDWFEPLPTAAATNGRYGFLGNRFQLGLRIAREPVEVFAQLQHSLLLDLPRNAVGPGGTYYANTPDDDQGEAILRSGWLRWSGALGVRGLSVTGGRQLYRDGLEALATDPALSWLQKSRIAERLIGPFDYTHVGRSFDGGQIAFDDSSLNVTAFGFLPTRGGFEIDANRTIREITVAGLSTTGRQMAALPGTHARLFYLYYDDRRDLAVVDNRPLAVRQADREALELHTLGAHAAHVEALGPGNFEVLIWGAGQLGDWQTLDHAAWAFACEAGYQLRSLPAAPWLRIGLDQSSGDQDPRDGTHETFFQILPTARQYAQFPFYNLMNNQDLFAMLLLRPQRAIFLRTDFHWLRATSRDDLLYAGGGATSDSNFGYSGTATGGKRGLGALVDVALTVQPTSQLTLYLYYGHVFGRGVIEQAFAGGDGDFGYLEALLSF